MAKRIVLKSQDINDKQFKIVPRGYDSLAVDEYLDRIIIDYETIENSIVLSKEEKDALDRRIQNLEGDVQKLELELNKLKSKYKNLKPGDKVTSDNLALIERINILEKFLWNNGFNPHLVK